MRYIEGELALPLSWNKPHHVRSLSKGRKAQVRETAHIHTWIVSMKRDLVGAILSEPPQ